MMNSINLLPVGYKAPYRFRYSFVFLLVLFIVGAVYLSYSILVVSLERQQLRLDLTSTEDQIATLAPVAELKDRISIVRTEADAIQTEYQQGRIYESDVLAMTDLILPDNVSVKTLEIAPDGFVTLTDCVAASYDALLEVLRNIQNIPEVQGIQMSRIVKGESEMTRRVMDIFPDREEEAAKYFNMGSLTTSDLFKDTYTFNISFRIASLPTS